MNSGMSFGPTQMNQKSRKNVACTRWKRIDAVSTSLGYKTSNTVQVSAGSTARLRLQMPPGTLNINALPWADVAVDGKKLGTTPLGNVSLPIGVHEIVFSHPQLGERRQSVTVTRSGVNRVSVDFNQR